MMSTHRFCLEIRWFSESACFPHFAPSSRNLQRWFRVSCRYRSNNSSGFDSHYLTHRNERWTLQFTATTHILIDTRDDDKIRAKSTLGVWENRDEPRFRIAKLYPFAARKRLRCRLTAHSTHRRTRDISLDSPDDSSCATLHFRRIEIAKNTRSDFSNPTCRDANRSVTPPYRTACDSRNDDDLDAMGQSQRSTRCSESAIGE